MGFSGRDQRLFGLVAGLLSSQILFLFALISAPEPAPVHGPYFYACIFAAIAIPSLVFGMIQIAIGDTNNVWIPGSIGVLASGGTVTAALWHFSSIAAVIGPVIFIAFAALEKRLPRAAKPPLDLIAIRELKIRRAEIAQHRVARKRLIRGG